MTRIWLILGVLALLTLPGLSQTSRETDKLPWADAFMHTDPVLERGLGPEGIRTGYAEKVLTPLGRNGETIDYYPASTVGRSGGKPIWLKFRVGEPVEARKLGERRNITLDGKNWVVETWQAERFVRCGNPIPSGIVFYEWIPAPVTITVIKTLPAPPPVVIRMPAELPVLPALKPAEVVNLAPVPMPTPVQPVVKEEVVNNYYTTTNSSTTTNTTVVMPSGYQARFPYQVAGPVYQGSLYVGVTYQHQSVVKTTPATGPCDPIGGPNTDPTPGATNQPIGPVSGGTIVCPNPPGSIPGNVPQTQPGFVPGGVGASVSPATSH